MDISVEIDATPEAVWAEVEQIERHPLWMSDAEAVHFLTDQRRGAGTTFRCPTKVGPLRTDDLLEITDWDEPRRIGVRHSGTVTGTGSFILEPIDHGRRTRLTWSETLRFPLWLGGPVTASLAGRLVLRRIWAANLVRLRQLIEHPGG